MEQVEKQEFDKQKLLDILDIDKANQKFEDKKEVVLQLEYSGEMHDAVVYIDKVFSPSKVKICIDEYISQLRHAKAFNLGFDQIAYEMYMIFLIIKNFSSLELPLRIEEQIPLIAKMMDTNILFPIFKEFDPTEIEKMTVELYAAIHRIEAQSEMFEEVLEQIPLENPEILIKDK